MKKDLRDRTKEMERINTRDREISFDLEETRLYFLEALSKLEVRESEMRRSGWRDLRKKLRETKR